MKDNFTAIVAILDASSSMSGLTHETIQGFNTFLADQQALPGEAVLTLAVFSSAGNYRLVHNAAPIQSVKPLTTADYYPSGWTALHDAIARTIDEVGAALAAMPEEERPSKVLFLITTDGEENSSRTYHAGDVHDRITHQTEKYSWEFVFVGANQADVVAVGQTLGIASTNSYNFTADAAGSAQLYANVSRGVSDFRSSALGSSYVMDDPTVVNGGPIQGLVGQTNQAQAFDLANLVTPQDLQSALDLQASQGFVPTICNGDADTVSVMGGAVQTLNPTPPAVQPTSKSQRAFNFTINDPFDTKKK